MPPRRFERLSLGLLVCVVGSAGCGSESDADDPTGVVEPGAGQGGHGDGNTTGDGDGSTGGDGDGSTGGDGDATGDGDGSTGGDGDATGDGDGSTGGDGDQQQPDPSALDNFSFFVTSLKAMRQLSGSQDGFGGDLRFGETGAGAGLRGADKICTTIAEGSMPGAGTKQWRAFLSTSTVNAKDRVGAGPWYDRNGRLVAQSLADLLQERPKGDASITSDLPNEDGVPNHNPEGTGNVDNHDTLTATNERGTYDGSSCSDWTSSNPGHNSGPRLGHSWPARSGQSWMKAHTAQGCAAGVNLSDSGGGTGGRTVGSQGGYGGIYCFALRP